MCVWLMYVSLLPTSYRIPATPLRSDCDFCGLYIARCCHRWMDTRRSAAAHRSAWFVAAAFVVVRSAHRSLPYRGAANGLLCCAVVTGSCGMGSHVTRTCCSSLRRDVPFCYHRFAFTGTCSCCD